MMPEIALNVLDIAQNSIRAGAARIEITVDIRLAEDKLMIVIADDGCGMTTEQLAQVEDPFYTTRTTRKAGLGVPFFKMAAVSTGGSFSIRSEQGKGTIVTAVFGLSHIDRMPLGDINGAIYTLVTFNTQIDFVYTYRFDGRSFTLDTGELKNILDGVPPDMPQVSQFIREFLSENKLEADGGTVIE